MSTALNAQGPEVAPNRFGGIADHVSPMHRAGTTRANEIAGKLERLITEYALKNGEYVGTKETLRRRFQVSPGTMNEAVRILETRGLVEMRRRLRGGIFVSTGPARVFLKHAVHSFEAKATLVEYCWSVFSQLEPLVVAEAARKANADSVAELNALAARMAAAAEDSVEALTWSRLLFRRIAEMGSNPLLTAIYTRLLDLLEQENPPPAVLRRLVARSQRAVAVIGSGDLERVGLPAESDRFATNISELRG
jgi:GntR family transcriptional repressor for pyruvate dehydrogenase complex